MYWGNTAKTYRSKLISVNALRVIIPLSLFIAISNSLLLVGVQAEQQEPNAETFIHSVQSYRIDSIWDIYIVKGSVSGEDVVGADVMVDGECVSFVEDDGTFIFAIEGGGWITIDLYLGDDRSVSKRHKVGIR